MADLNLATVRKRAEAATKGPWQTGATPRAGEVYFGTVVDPDDPTEPGVLLGSVGTEADAEFIAHAREDVPDLLAEIDRLTRALREIGKDRNTWARQLADAKDERDTAAAERDQERTRRAETGNERDALYAVLRELVELKDGPRDDAYERRKPAAWTWARRVLSNWEAV